MDTVLFVVSLIVAMAWGVPLARKHLRSIPVATLMKRWFVHICAGALFLFLFFVMIYTILYCFWMLALHFFAGWF